MSLVLFLAFALGLVFCSAGEVPVEDLDPLFAATAQQEAPPNSIHLISKDLYGAGLRSELKKQYEGHTQYSYDKARIILYGYVCNEEGRDSLECLYSGSKILCEYGTDHTSCHQTDGNLSAEHIVPKTYFNNDYPPMSDMHHLRPAWRDVNSARNRYPFDWVPGSRGSWYRDYTRLNNEYPPEGERSEWSHYNGQMFEPRAKAKGLVSRAAAYIFTMYPDYLENISNAANFDTLLSWNEEYPPDDDEKTQNTRIYERQKNENPYVLDHTLFRRAYCDLLVIGCSEFDGSSAVTCSDTVQTSGCTECSSPSVCISCPDGHLFDKRVPGTVSCVSKQDCSITNGGTSSREPGACLMDCSDPKFGNACLQCSPTECLACSGLGLLVQGQCNVKDAVVCDQVVIDSGCIECSETSVCERCAGTLLFDKRTSGTVGCVSKTECVPLNGGRVSDDQESCLMECSDPKFGDICSECNSIRCLACEDKTDPVDGKCQTVRPVVCDQELVSSGCTECLTPSECSACPTGRIFDKRDPSKTLCIRASQCITENGGRQAETECVLDCTASLFGDYCKTCTLGAGCSECRDENGALDSVLQTCTYVDPGTGCAPEVEKAGCLQCSSDTECINCGGLIYDRRVPGTVSCILPSQCQLELAGELSPEQNPQDCVMNCSHQAFGEFCTVCTPYGGCSECQEGSSTLDSRFHVCRTPELKKASQLMSAEIFWIVIGCIVLAAVLGLIGWGISIIVKRKLSAKRDPAF